MATNLTDYLKKLGSGSPKIGAWFRSKDYKINRDFGSVASNQRPLDGLEIEFTGTSGNVGFFAPFNGFVQFAIPRMHEMKYQVAGESDRIEKISDPTLAGLKHMDGTPFRPDKGY